MTPQSTITVFLTDLDLRKSIMGHWWRGKSVDEGYDLFDDEDRVAAIDAMTYDHGETRILTSRRGKSTRRYKRGTPSKTENPLQTVVNR